MTNRLLKAKIIERFGSQVDFARLLGISEDRLSKYIHGRLHPSEEEQLMIAQKLGVNQGEIFSSN
jgi:DNA-binding transcriptional regulator YdaS (Cro superfamily)